MNLFLKEKFDEDDFSIQICWKYRMKPWNLFWYGLVHGFLTY